MHTIIWFIYFWSYLACTMFLMWKAKRLARQGKIKEHDEMVRFHVKRWAWRMFRFAGGELTVTGLENIPEGPCVFASNHQGYFDIPLMLSGLDAPHPIIAKKEIERIPMVRSWMRELHCLFIDRENARQAMDCLKRAGELLAQGYSVVIFPEGTRSKGGEIKEFKGGTVRVATRAKVPIVPVCVEGTYKMMEQNHYWIHPAKVSMSILPPIETKDLSREEIKALDERLHQIITEERNKLLGR